MPPDRSTPRPLTLPIQLPALRARRSSFFLRWRRTHRISRSDRLIVELVDTGSTPVVILIRPAAEHSAEARGRFILDHDPAAAAQSDGPQLTATNQLPHELSE